MEIGVIMEIKEIKEIETGDILFLKQSSNTVVPVSVTKVGKKFLYIDDNVRENTFNKKTLAMKGTTEPRMLFTSEKDFYNYLEKKRLWQEIASIFMPRNGNLEDFTLDDLQEIRRLAGNY
jgi:hypothetical protein